MSTLDENNVGRQLEGKALYERQKIVRSSPNYLFGPTIVAENLRIPENMGSVLRLADAAGCRETIFLTDGHLRDLSRVQKMARNCHALVDWKTETFANFLNEDIENSAPLVAIELTTCSKNLFNVRLPRECTFVVGNERFGISPELLKKCSYAVHIPMYGVNGSMNVSHAFLSIEQTWM